MTQPVFDFELFRDVTGIGAVGAQSLDGNNWNGGFRRQLLQNNFDMIRGMAPGRFVRTGEHRSTP